MRANRPDWAGQVQRGIYLLRVGILGWGLLVRGNESENSWNFLCCR